MITRNACQHDYLYCKSPFTFFSTFYEIYFATILKLYVGLGLEKIPPTVIHLNYNGNAVHVFESYLNQISKMSMYFNHIWINIGSVFVLKICIWIEI